MHLPRNLMDYLEQRAREHGSDVNTELAIIVARERAADQQRHLDEALALDDQDNRDFARTASTAVRNAFTRAAW
jgi:hypothetical protein